MSGQFDLGGKVAVVTGASRGLGQYFSRALARAGADIVITSRTVESLAQTQADVEALGRRALPCQLDTRKLETIQPVVDKALAEFGRIDILVNNAGCNIRKAAVAVTPEDWSTVVDTILKGAFFAAQAVVRSAMLPQQKGRIINIGSETTLFGFPGIVPYCASRGGMTQMTKALAAEWAPSGITVNVLVQGWFNTAQTAILCSSWMVVSTSGPCRQCQRRTDWFSARRGKTRGPLLGRPGAGRCPLTLLRQSRIHFQSEHQANRDATHLQG